ncbi:phosphotransmitter protein Ypd1, putative [Talaromyces stipitatus ATCC 10500]|uniref:Phosphotransmitter protein Ypd1, putative n=1 Tax=Talaromyces stipitatus (strain ATCC 10500 / CBS 375.48 / QM 6759 / NRRL 1006) TaxID=441959 RepID=B8LWS3_TALSN|nr:phosphotransmitter protein Ypd1, putative [Talaromyces stipitatus ATCC 10500]XP_002341858.1 phosphotransmitter protein Ypd1, putative [Talaromyces stipitatus ATCC 10500]XP_002341859.1 phosphotransmitter protein Ypd1, putative [Talaromyces stipitatus ATCC 10500]XP_002341860.1 phosphotransmitter protein Ypd1, putative [Talaromyces stipitatus ATCC 10500]XP_002341861.1 phosphotransmitter protein Ypd1, putative [Talaromyces stipitatus ATCC 10500]EED24470.1 phosphotransmitter protein Ypd1, putati
MAPSQTSKQNPKKQEEGPPDLRDYQDKIDYTTFEQILEMDDDEDDRDFSQGIVFGFFEQAEATFEKMESALAENDFNDLSQLGHFLKGSSATLGLTKVKDACEKIQHCKEDLPDEKEEAEREKAIDGIKKTLNEVQVDYKEVANILRRFFGVDPVPDTTDEKNGTTEEKKSESPKAEKK